MTSRIDMRNVNAMRFPIDVILVCIRADVDYPLSYGHVQEFMQERGVSVEHSSISIDFTINGADAMSCADNWKINSAV